MCIISLCTFLDPKVKNMDGENVLHVAVQSACDDVNIAEVAKQLLSKWYDMYYTMALVYTTCDISL